MQWFRDRRVRGRPPHPDVLTPAEWRVLEQVREGLPNAEIAVRLGLSVPTVKTHVSSMLAKLELRDRSQLAAWDGEPAEASRSALARFALGAPLGWLREGLAASYLGKAALVAGVAAISVGGYVAVAGLSGAGGGGRVAPSATETATATAVVEEPTEQIPVGWLDIEGLPARFSFDALDTDGTPDTWIVVDPETGEWTQQQGPEVHGPLRADLAWDRYWIDDGDVLDTRTGDRVSIAPAWDGRASPDGRWAAVVPDVEGSNLQVVEVETGIRYNLGDLGKPVQLVWSPGNTLAIQRDGELYLVSGPEWQPRSVGAMLYQRPTWSPEGDALAFFDEEGLYVSDAELTNRRLILRFPPDVAPLGERLAWSPDGGRIAFTTGTGVNVADPDSGQVFPITPSDLRLLGDPPPVWSPDGGRVAFHALLEDERQGIIVAHADRSGVYLLLEDVPPPAGWTEAGIVVRVSLMP